MPTSRMRIRPTTASVILVVVLVAVMLGAVNYQSNAAYVLMALVLSFALVSTLHGWRNLAGIRVVAGETVSPFAGDPLRATVTVTNSSRREAHFLSCDVPGVELEGGATAIPHVPAGGSVTVELVLPPRLRGLHAISRVRVSTVFPMGLFRLWCELPAAFTWMVYPRPAYDGLPAPETNDQAEPVAGGRPGGGDFRGHRPYQLGDPQRHVDWKAVARGRPLLVKEYDGGGAARWWIEWTATPGLDTEARLSRLAGWVVEADRDGYQFGLRLPDRELEPATGQDHYHACLSALSMFRGA